MRIGAVGWFMGFLLFVCFLFWIMYKFFKYLVIYSQWKKLMILFFLTSLWEGSRIPGFILFLFLEKLDYQYPQLKPFYCHFYFLFANPGLCYEWTESIESRVVSCYFPYLNHYTHIVVLVSWNKFKTLKRLKDTYISQADVTYIYLAFTSKNVLNVHFCYNVSDVWNILTVECAAALTLL